MDSLTGSLFFVAASAACVAVAGASRSSLLRRRTDESAGTEPAAPADVLLAVLTELAGAAETVLEEGLPAAVASARSSAAAAASRGVRARPAPPVDRLFESLVSEAGEAAAARAGVSDAALGAALASARRSREPRALALEARVLAAAPLAGLTVAHALAAVGAAARAEAELWRAAAAHVRRGRGGGAAAPPPGARAFSRAVRREWRARRAAQQPLPPPYDRVLPAAAHVLTPTSAAVVALGAPWTPPRAALWQEIAIALQARDARGDIARASALAQRDEEALLRQLGVLPAPDDAGEDEDEAAE